MKKIVDKILNGQFEYDRGTLVFSAERIELTIKPGEDAEGSFTVQGPKNRTVEGQV